jgi:hypothetical protein
MPDCGLERSPALSERCAKCRRYRVLGRLVSDADYGMIVDSVGVPLAETLAFGRGPQSVFLL